MVVVEVLGSVHVRLQPRLLRENDTDGRYGGVKSCQSGDYVEVLVGQDEATVRVFYIFRKDSTTILP